MVTPVVLPTLLMALPLTHTDMVPLLPQEAEATVVTLPIHLTPMAEVGVTMVGVAMALPLLAAVVAIMDDINSTNNAVVAVIIFCWLLCTEFKSDSGCQ